MALIKQIKNQGSHTLVTFTVANDQTLNSSNVMLLGDFNDWQRDDSSQMEKDGQVFAKSLKLENGKRYEFRYLSEGINWFNDGLADDYVPSPYVGIENSVVDLVAVPVKKKVVKKTKKVKKDDLKKIEGIGVKIAAIFVEKGIDTFEKLSKTKVSILENILKEAGPRFSMHKPGSWPKQAKLAFQGKWEALKKLQDKLDGGK